jgi:hypothetical protein
MLDIRMIFTILRYAVALFAGAALHGCTWYVYDATNRPIASNIAGKCFALRDDAILFRALQLLHCIHA